MLVNLFTPGHELKLETSHDIFAFTTNCVAELRQGKGLKPDKSWSIRDE